MRIELNFPNAVKIGTDLFDRQNELSYLEETLQSPIGRSVVVFGERRVGKTSLLNVTAERLQQKQKAILVHLPHVETRDQFAYEIAAAIYEEVGSNLTDSPLFDSHDQFHLRTISEFVHLLKKAWTQKPDLVFVPCLDELDSMLEDLDDATATAILDLILHLVEKSDLPLHFLFTMTQVSHRILRSYKSTFLNSAKLVELLSWNKDVTYEFVKWLLKDRFVVDEQAQERLYQMGGGHSYFTKAILQALLDRHAHEPQGFSINLGMLDSAVGVAARSPEVELVLSNLEEAQFTEAEKDIIQKIAFQIDGLAQERIQDSAAYQAAADLVKRGYLDLTNGTYCPRLGILFYWLQQKGAPQDMGILVDVTNERVWMDEQLVSLTKLEFGILRFLAERSDTVFATDELRSEVARVSDRKFDQIMSGLIERFRGSGYLRFDPEKGYSLTNVRIENRPAVTVTDQSADRRR